MNTKVPNPSPNEVLLHMADNVQDKSDILKVRLRGHLSKTASAKLSWITAAPKSILTTRGSSSKNGHAASTDFKIHCPCSVLRIWRSTGHLRQVNSCLRAPETWTWSSHGTPSSAGTAKVAFLGISPRGRLVQVRRIMSDLLILLHKATGKAG